MSELPDKKRKAKAKAKSGYLLFMDDVRPELVKSKPDLAFGDMTREVATKWKNLSPSEKKVIFMLIQYYSSITIFCYKVYLDKSEHLKEVSFTLSFVIYSNITCQIIIY